MKRTFLLTMSIIFVLVISVFVTSCFGSGGTTSTPTVSSTNSLKPKPSVEKVVATTSGTEKAYYAILEIKVKNEGAEGTVLVEASITQAGKTIENSMPVFLKQGESHEIKLTFPLVWRGGEFTSNVRTIIP